MRAAAAEMLRRHGGLWLLIALTAAWMPAGPMALLVGVILLWRTSRCVARWMSPEDAWMRIPAVWLSASVEIPLIAEGLSLSGALASVGGWLYWQLAIDVAVHWVDCVKRGTGTDGGGSRDGLGLWRRAIARAPTVMRAFLGVTGVLLAGNLLVAAASGIVVQDAVTTYVPLCIDFVQRGTLALPAHDHSWPFPAHFTAWHTTYIYTLVLGDSLYYINVLGWLSTVAGIAATAGLCRLVGLSRVVSLVLSGIAYSAPLAVCQAANANFDQQAGFCMAMTVYSAVRAMRRPSGAVVALLALSQVLLVATKLTAAFVAPVILAMDLAVFIRCRRAGQSSLQWRFVVVAVIATLMMLGPHFARNKSTYGRFIPETPNVSARPTGWDEMWTALGLRSMQLLLPYELGWMEPLRSVSRGGAAAASELAGSWSSKLSERWIRVSPGTVRGAINHLLAPYDSDKAYLGAIPLMAVVVLACSLWWSRTEVGWRRHTLWLFVGIWVAFQIGYARLFRYTPHNGRYMLLAWFLVAPVLGLALRKYGRAWRRGLLVAAAGIAGFEHADWFLHRAHAPLSVLFNEPRSEHFRLVHRQKSNLSEIRRRLDEMEVRQVAYDTSRGFQLLYYDSQRRRRLEYRAPLPMSEGCVIFTELPTPRFDDGALRVLRDRFEIVYAVGENDGTERRCKAFLFPYVLRVDRATDLVRIDEALGRSVGLLELRAPRRGGGVHAGPDWRDVVWLGSGETGRLEMLVESAQEQDVMVRLLVGATSGAGHELQLRCEGSVGGSIVDVGASVAAIGARLGVGTNKLALWVESKEESATDRAVYVSDIAIESRESISRQKRVLYFREGAVESGVWVAGWAARGGRVFRVDRSLDGVAHLIGVQVAPEIGAVEHEGATDWVWLGPREEGELRGLVRSRRKLGVELEIEVEKAGVALPDDTTCPVEVVVDERVVNRFTVTGPGTYQATVPLEAGDNIIRIRAATDADEGRYGPDSRRTMLLLNEVRLKPGGRVEK